MCDPNTGAADKNDPNHEIRSNTKNAITQTFLRYKLQILTQPAQRSTQSCVKIDRVMAYLVSDRIS